MRVLGGIQPSNNLHIGNLFGCINLFKKFKNDDLYLFVPDIHSLTSHKHINKSNIYDVIRYYLAVLGNDSNTYFYIQSEHNYVFKLSFILSCNTQIGDLQRMTQFKDKSQGNKESVNYGLLSYPILMAADILSISANIIPVGKDQIQHIEMTKRIAEKFNSKYNNNILTIPQVHVLEEKLIYNLKDVSIKMSKSKGNMNGVIFLNDSKDIIYNKIKKAVSDSLPMPINIEELTTREAIRNLINIYSFCSNMSINDIIKKFENMQISVFKEELGHKLGEYIEQIHTKAKLYTDQDILNIVNNSRSHINHIFKLHEELINKIIYNYRISL